MEPQSHAYLAHQLSTEPPGSFVQLGRLRAGPVKLEEEVMVWVDERRVEVCRLEPGAEWHRSAYGAAETMELASVNVRLPLDAVYERCVH